MDDIAESEGFDELRKTKPEFEGDFHGQVHDVDTTVGHRIVTGKMTDPNTGEEKFVSRKVPNKVKSRHVWDHDKKEWENKGFITLLPGASVFAETGEKHVGGKMDGKPKSTKIFQGSNEEHEAKISTTNVENAKTPMDIARQRAIDNGHIKGDSSTSKKPKTITRKLNKGYDMSKLSKLEYKLREMKKALCEKMDMFGSESVNTADMGKADVAPDGSNNRESYKKVFEKADECEDAVKEHEDKKHSKEGHKDEHKKMGIKSERITLSKNGQWSLDKSDDVEEAKIALGQTSGKPEESSPKNYSKHGEIKNIDPKTGKVTSTITERNGIKLGQLNKSLDEKLEELYKAVRNPTVSSPSAYENPNNVEGAAKKKKYQGGDPRHAGANSKVNSNKTKAGLDREVPVINEKNMSHTSGSSSLRTGTKLDDYERDETNTTSGKKVKWSK